MSEYLSKLIVEIDRLKENNRKVFFRMNEKINPSISKEITEYFKPPQYQTEVKPCSNCGGYDIIIKWS